MHAFIDLIQELATQYPQYAAALCYLLICGVLILSGFGLPMPEDIPLLAAGVVSYYGYTQLQTMLVTTFICVLGADMILYHMGARYGLQMTKWPWIKRYMTAKRLARAEQYFKDHGGKTMFIARFLPGLRAAVWFSAGLLKIHFWKMALFDGLAALLSVPVLVLMGFYGAGQLEKMQQWAHWGQWTVMGIIALGIVYFVVYKMCKKKKC